MSTSSSSNPAAVRARSNGSGASPGSPKQQPQRRPASLLSKLWKQTKYCLWGALGTYYLDVPTHLQTVYAHSGLWPSHLVLLALTFLALTIGIFAYLILLPFRGVAPSYTRWSHDPILRTLVPVLTLAIVGGFLSLVLALSPLCAPPRTISSTLAETLSQAASAGAKQASAASADTSSLFSKFSLEFTRALRHASPSSPSGAAETLSSAAKDASTSAQLAALDVGNWLRHRPSVETIARQLGISPARAAEVQAVLAKYSGTVDVWLRGGSNSLLGSGPAGGRQLGWIGAGLGGTATYLLVFGFMGLIGLAAPSPASVKTKAKRQ
ncbi:unnamed protein product [Tilletia controversa]|nr:hypothetical protein CF328_g1359 [Tilletia controversa]CAD6910478.1 unnamed protein product [Tilletia controversa]CAD6964741.1 unnamed protein product [Tilletia controversa]CAD6972733.1 unnamed protein product [Tilletia controversa]CAD6975016.1 unnamed protein product [Tilletia controversa]